MNALVLAAASAAAVLAAYKGEAVGAMFLGFSAGAFFVLCINARPRPTPRGGR